MALACQEKMRLRTDGTLMGSGFCDGVGPEDTGHIESFGKM